MSVCNLEYIDRILNSVEDFLYLEGDQFEQTKNVTLLENFVKTQTGLGEFKLDDYIAASNEFKEGLENAFNVYGLVISDFVSDITSSNAKAKSNISNNFSSVEISDLFHTLPLVKADFENKSNSKILKEILIGKADSKTYVSSDEEINQNIIDLKNKLFNDIQVFLRDKGKLNKEIKTLYNEHQDIEDYNHYKEVMNLLDKYFFAEKNFETISTYTNKNIPNLDMDLRDVEGILNAYYSGILLSNFDSYIKLNFSELLDVNYNVYNDLRTSFNEENKYSLKIKGIATEYWLEDSHSGEGSETSESKLVKLLISTIPVYNMKNESVGTFMEMKDFYLLASKISNFEILEGNKLRNKKDSNFEYFNTNPKEKLLWYLDEIQKAMENAPDSIQEFKKYFDDTYGFILSLKNYINSPELNIKTKESNSIKSILNIFAQVINNNYGAAYTKYNANGKYKIQEMYKQNFNNINVQSMVFTKLFNNSEKKFFEGIEENVKNIFKDISKEANLKNLPKSTKKKICSLIQSKTGIYLTYDGFDDVIDDLKVAENKDISSIYLENSLLQLMSDLNKDLTVVSKAAKDKVITKTSKGDDSVSEYIENTISNPLFKAINNAYLLNHPVKVVMNVETLTGEKLPTFKLATLTYKDTEILEEQRKFEKAHGINNVFKSLLIQDDPALLGTGTKLELVNGDINKEAVKFNVAENFISDFQFDFLQNITKNKSFAIMIGNYSDKNTVLTKIINADFKINNTAVSKLPMKTLLDTVKTQAGSYYKDALNKVLNDYAILLDLKLDKDIEKNIKIVNDALEKTNVRSLSKKASDLKINLTEQLHYSKYNERTALNQTLVDNYRIFNNDSIFKEFVKRQENSMVDKFKKFNKSDKLKFTSTGGNFKVEDTLSSLGLTKKDFEGETFDYLTDSKEELNPLLKKWMWMNALFRNEYLFVTGKGEYMHPAKKVSYRGTSNDLNHKDENIRKTYWENYEAEVGKRLAAMAKRNVMFTATIEAPIRKSKLGVPENVNMATIEDMQGTVFNISGEVKNNQDIHDGSSFINYIYSKMIDASYPDKEYAGTKKQFATFVTEYGNVIKKDAESVITNDRIRNSLFSDSSHFNRQKKSLNIPIGSINFEFKQSLGNYFLNKDGEDYRIESLSITNNSYKMYTSKKVGNEWVLQPEAESGTYKSLFDLWELFGGAFSTDKDGNFNEGSNDLLYEVVTTADKYGNYPLKDKMIHILSNLSAVKAGGVNVNSKEKWSNNADLAYFTFSNRFMGPQLYAGHEVNESVIKEVTQVISALSQNTSTAHLAKEAYEDIANVIRKAAKPYKDILFPTNDSKYKENDLYKYLAEKFVKTIENTKGDTIAKILLGAFGKDVNIPFSNQNFFVPFVRDVITRMNNEFITRYYSGTGAVLIPSHGIIQLYDIEQPDGTIRTITQSDLAKEALKNYDSSRAITKNDKIIWGHPGIGKTFLHQTGRNDIIDFDSVYKPRINKELGLPESAEGLKERQEFRRKNPEAYKQKIIDLWTEAKNDAKQSGKTLLASDLILLKEFSNDFNKIINMPSETFIERSKQRGEPDAADKMLWKNDIDAALANVDQNKVFTTNKYISDLFARNNIEIISNYANTLLKSIPTTWDKIQVGDTIERSMEELDPILKKEFDSISSLEFQTEQSVNAYMDMIHKKERYVTLNTPELYYKYKLQYNTAQVNKVLNKPRDLKPAEINFTILHSTEEEKLPELITMNLFDTDSVRLRFSFEQMLKNKNSIDTTSNDYIILNNFNKAFSSNELIDNIKNDNKEKTFVNNFIGLLNKWTQRNMELLDNRRVMKPVTIKTDFNIYFNGDNLLTTFSDAKNQYNDTNSIPVTNYKFKEAELIMGDLYQSNFNRSLNDSLYEIKQKGPLYFYNKLTKDFTIDDKVEADIKLNLSNLDHPVYIKYVENLPGNDHKLNIKAERILEDNIMVTKYVRYNELGEPVYTLPDHDKVRVKVDKDGREIIYIKAINTTYTQEERVINKVKGFENNLSNLIKSFKGNISSFVPLMNNNIGKNLNFNTVTEFSSYSGYEVDPNSKIHKDWFKDNKIAILEQLSKKMFSSWEKSHEVVAARIPSQSMQSFMPMKNVAYLNTEGNDAYVSIWQIWLQGSDFDIDKAYILGSGFNKNGHFDSWSKLTNYSTKEQLDELEKLPLPNGNTTEIGTLGADLTNLFEEFSDEVKDMKELSPKAIRVLDKAIRTINASNSTYTKNIEKGRKDGSISTKNIKVDPVIINSENATKIKLFIDYINKHNLDASYKKGKDAVKNSVVSRIKQIISTPSNQILATTPVDVQIWHDAADKALESKNTSQMILSPYDMFSMYKQQRDAAVGKDDVGIAANGLKAMFALSSYFNDYYTNRFDTSEKLRFDNKTFKKSFTFTNASGETTTYNPAAVADVDISQAQIERLKGVLGNIDIYRNNTAVALSSFTSAATDNAKELLMAKVNASVELASMHIYLMILGFTPDQIANIMTSDVVEDIINRLEINAFFETKKPKVNVIISKLATEYKNDPVKTTNLKAIQDIYQGAQEVKLLSRFLSSNQRTSANTEELSKFLSNFETSIFTRENIVFGDKLKNFNDWKDYKNSADPVRASEANINFSELVDKIFEHNKVLNSVLDRTEVERILTEASNVIVHTKDGNGNPIDKTVSLLGGNFDLRYYINEKNSEYRKLAKEYYNLIKNTFNILDVIDEVPHFKAMIDGITLSHEVLMNSSAKYGFVYDTLKETIRNNANRIIFFDEDTNKNVKNQMGNSSLPISTDSKAISKALLGADIRLRAKWLKSPKASSKLHFNVTELLKEANKLLPNNKIASVPIYLTDDARNINLAEVENSTNDIKFVKDSDTEDTIINLNTNYGIASFKKVVENILLPVLQSKSGVISESLKLQSVFNAFGIRGNSITSTFPLGDIANPVAANRAKKMLKAFNDLDIDNNTKGFIKDSSGNSIPWRDVLYVYNLIVNNDKYGDLRLTPLFEDYLKEPNSLGFDYVTYSAKLDSKKIKLFDVEEELQNNPVYLTADEDTKKIIKEQTLKEIDNDILFYTFNTGGKLSIKGSSLRGDELSVINPDFIVVTSLTETPENKRRWKELSDIMKLIKSRGFIIKFEC